MTILGLDTSSPQDTAIGIYLGPDTSLSLSLHLKRSQESKLLATIDAGLHSLGVTLSDIELIAVGLGPGSFTGLRIGLAAARALAWGGNKQIIGIPSLELLAASHPAWDHPGTLLVPAIDAHMGHIFSGLYLDRTLCGGFLDIPPADLSGYISSYQAPHIHLIGNALLKYPELEKLSGIDSAPHTLISGSALWIRALSHLEQRGPDKLENIHPLYLRKSEAERQLEND